MSKFALLIGINEYTKEFDFFADKLKPNAIKDINALRDILINPDIGGFAETDVMMLRNPSYGNEIEDAVSKLYANRQEDDLVLLYFSGHSILDEQNRFYFAPSKIFKIQNRINFSTHPLSASSIHKIMSESKSQQQVIILDCEYGGHFTRDFYVNNKNCAILMAAEYTLPELDRSIYTRFLIEGLRTGAGNREGDNLLSVEELHTYASTEARMSYPKFFSCKEGGEIKLSKIPKDAPLLKYRKEVQSRMRGGLISIPARESLNSLLIKLKLEPTEAEKIESEVLHPYEKYTKVLIDTLQEDPILSEETKIELKNVQDGLGIEDKDALLIHKRILEKAAKIGVDEKVSDASAKVEVLSQPDAKQKPIPELNSISSTANEPVEIFFSYAHEDEELRDKLAKHLKLLKREGTIKAWHDRNITAGEEWKKEIDTHLESAGIILLLISADFLASDYCYEIEMTRALERYEEEGVPVIPIILRCCDWHDSPFGKLVALPTDGKPITSWQNQDEAFTDVVKGLRKVVKRLQERPTDLRPAIKEPNMIPEPVQKTPPMTQTNTETSTGFQINATGSTININSPIHSQDLVRPIFRPEFNKTAQQKSPAELEAIELKKEYDQLSLKRDLLTEQIEGEVNEDTKETLRTRRDSIKRKMEEIWGKMQKIKN